MTPLPPSLPQPDGALARAVRRAAGAAAGRPRTAIALWLVLVVGCAFAGGLAGTRTLTETESGVGESARADRQIEAAGLRDPAVESVLVRSAGARSARAAADALTARLRRLPEVASVQPRDELSTAVLVQARLRGDPDDAGETVVPVQDAVAAVAHEHPDARLQQAGPGSFDHAIEEIVADDLRSAELISLPLTLVILVLAFGALVAAFVPLVLGITAVAAAMGALGVVSQIAPSGETTASVVVLIGLAVGVDYSLFYIRREREERRAGRGAAAALDAAAASVGRAILVSGLTVIVALAGLLLSGSAMFVSMGLASMLVVAIAALGSLTVLPAMLALLGDRVDRGRLPFGRRGRCGTWALLAGVVTRRPRAALVTAVCLLATLAVPVLQMDTADSALGSLPPGTPVVAAQNAIERAFPGAPSTAQLVVRGDGLDAPGARHALGALGARAAAVTGGKAAVQVDVARDGRTALVSVPLSAQGAEAERDAIAALRDRVAPSTPGGRALVTGEAARSADFSHRMASAIPVVIAFVLALAFALLLSAFRSPRLAAAVVGLNLLSVGAAFGVLVAVFQHRWAEDLLGFHSTGTIVSWLPLFSFVVLFGLSMDYTVLVLERIREARRAGRTPAAAAAEGVAATAGTVTSAAVVMVAIFAVFATMRLLDMKQMGVGLAAAVLLDVTIVRAVALPAAIALLGEEGWRVRRPRAPRRGAPVEVAA